MNRPRIICLVLLTTLCLAAAADDPPAEVLLGFAANTTLPVGEWKDHPVEPERTLFGPLAGLEAELRLLHDRFFYGFAGRFVFYDTSEVIGVGSGVGEIQDAAANSLYLQAQAGYYFDAGGLGLWAGAAAGVEFFHGREELPERTFEYDQVIAPALTLTPLLGLDVLLAGTTNLTFRLGFDYSLGQITNLGEYSGAGTDVTFSVGLAFRP